MVESIMRCSTPQEASVVVPRLSAPVCGAEHPALNSQLVSVLVDENNRGAKEHCVES